MDKFQTRPDWTHFQERWLDYAQRVKAQWPEISFSDILATRGDRSRLCACVSETYGLDSDAADRAVTIWHSSQIDPGTDGRTREPTVA